jgi:TolB protein
MEVRLEIRPMKTLALALSVALAAPALAQSSAAPPASAATPAASDDDGGLSGSTTYEGAWQDLGIAIPAFATNADVPTPANQNGTGALGRELARVIDADLKNNGLFKPTGPDALPAPAYGDITNPQWGVWQSRGAEMLVEGFVRAGQGGQLTVGCYLYDLQLKKELVREGWVVSPADWRRAAHKCADLVYSRLSGESPFFDSRIAYIAETGPKGHRIKRLAIMDSDGANHRFITNGQSTALTPRYSPDYKQIVYLSFLSGTMRVYVYDIGTGHQRLVTQSKNPTMAPRWSPDGKYILYSMATGGNTDIYRVPATGGASVRLTDSPGIDVGGSYSPDGSKIVFESDRSGAQQCYVMNADGSNQRRISFFGGRCATPEWSPRGDQIAFTHIAGNFSVAVMTPDGKNVRDLTHGWQDEAPTWSPNGRIIQFFRTSQGATGTESLWQVDLTGRNLRKLPTPVGASDPAWGPVLP